MNKVKSWAQMQEEARLAALRSQMQAQQVNQGRMPWGGGQQYAGGSPGFDERTGQASGEGYLSKLMKKYGDAAQGVYGDAREWLGSRVPSANRQYQRNRNRFIDQRVDEP